MKINYTLEKDEYLEALQLHNKGGLRTLLMFVYAGFAIVVILVSTNFSDMREVIRNFFILFFSLSFYFLLTRMMHTFQSKKLYDKSTTLSKEVTLRITGRGIKIDDQSSSIAWDSFSKWKENEGYYVLYLSMRNFKIIPKRAMSEVEEKEFKGYLEKYLPQVAK